MLVGDPLLPFAVPSPVPSSSAKGSHQRKLFLLLRFCAQTNLFSVSCAGP